MAQNKLKMRFSNLFLFALLFLLLSTCKKKEPSTPLDAQELKVSSVQFNRTDLTDGMTNIPVDAILTISFSKQVADNITTGAISLADIGGEIAKSLAISTDGKSVIINFDANLAYISSYVLKIAAGKLGKNGEQLAQNFELSFITKEEPQPLFAAGNGTLANPYLIETAEQLDLVRYFSANHYSLTKDLNLKPLSDKNLTGWIPIGNENTPFTGTFDGNGNSISGLFIQQTLAGVLGLFGVLDGNGEIRNLHLKQVDITVGSSSGALVGIQVNGLIENCHSSGAVSAVGGMIGGLVGLQQEGIIVNCSSSCDIISENAQMGGLVGLSQNGQIQNSFATGYCRSFASEIGGLIGTIKEGAQVVNSYATGDVLATMQGGGLVGLLEGVLSGSYATGNIRITSESETGDYAGNVVGQIGLTGSVSTIYYPNTQTIDYKGNSPITNDGMAVDITLLSCTNPNNLFPYLNFSTIWKCNASRSWMVLQWE